MLIRCIRNNYKQEKDRLRKLRHKAMQEAVKMVEADAKLICPVDTGNLRRSLTSSVKSDENKTVGRCGSGVEYAYFAERHSPYLEPALNQNLEKIRRRIAEVMSE